MSDALLLAARLMALDHMEECEAAAEMLVSQAAEIERLTRERDEAQSLRDGYKSIAKEVKADRDRLSAENKALREALDDALRSYELTGNVTALVERVAALAQGEGER